MYLLDNDTYSQFQQGHEKITARLLSVRRTKLWLPAVLVEEQLRGRLAVLAALNPKLAADSLRVPPAYDLLLKTLRDLQDFQHLPYTSEAEKLYQSWPPAVKRLGTRDCRIAATAIVSGFTVITCNTRHFQPMPGVSAEDWSV